MPDENGRAPANADARSVGCSPDIAEKNSAVSVDKATGKRTISEGAIHGVGVHRGASPGRPEGRDDDDFGNGIQRREFARPER
ncbi:MULTISPECIES: hypothetical protein [Frankia]|uniref:Uncharacterized protein n=1 Tax=Frankia alni (strain DSM 45986 / CECT 9034 / ACN14a) TaxID=326424 RepID=Q0RCK3_FRAAA|nr:MULTISPECIES: hypothetical protein [Frankia]CAJ64821.1 hypothetical protein FRAAL6198 [Frankia alni ACN14a]